MPGYSPTTGSLTPIQKALLAIEKLQQRLRIAEARGSSEPIAIVGMSCRLPGGSDSPAAFWSLLDQGRNAASPSPPGRWTETISLPDGAYLDGVDAFDADFFGLAPREAIYMDPQHRLLLECAWEALEHSGIVPADLRATRTGVYIGIGQQDYLQLIRDAGLAQHAGIYLATGNAYSFSAGHLSYLLGLNGPSVAFDTACSSSLVALHFACQSLRAGECDVALAAGVQVILLPAVTEMMNSSGALSPDGRCKSFDAAADGYGRGEGCGAVVLKKLSDARRQGDAVLAVVYGSAINHDGPSSGLTVPSGAAQQALLRQALASANLAAADVSYVEAHGTGTPLGDPIEINAIGAIYCQGRPPEAPLKIGAVKSNIGHLEAAAGIAGVIKVLLALQHERLPAQADFRVPNPDIPWQRYPLQVLAAAQPWPRTNIKRIAGISSFGLSGSNAHVLIGDAPDVEAPPPPESATGPLALHLSAKTPAALSELCERYAALVANATVSSLPGLCNTASAVRSHFAQRVAVVADDAGALVTALRDVAARPPTAVGSSAPRAPRLALLFTGQGVDCSGVARGLGDEPAFIAALGACADHLQAEGKDPRTSLLHGSNRAPTSQPELFALEYALAQLWLSWGVKPYALLGHSLGEIVAACVAGVFTLPDALRLVAARDRLMNSLPDGGGMLAVMAGEPAVRSHLDHLSLPLDIASVNGPELVVVSGPVAAIAELATALRAARIGSRLLPVSHAFHSRLVEPVLQPFREIAKQLTYRQPTERLISTVTGERADASIATADYWVDHIRRTVQFERGIRQLADMRISAFLEIGPQPLLTGMGRNCLPDTAATWCSSLGNGTQAKRSLAEAVAALFRCGIDFDRRALWHAQPHLAASLPTYPWQRQRLWLPREIAARSHRTAADAPAHPMITDCVRSPMLSDVLFRGSIGVDVHPWLAAHKIFDRVVVAGATHLSLLFGMVRALRPGPATTMVDIDFATALVLGAGETREVHGLAKPGDSGDLLLSVVSLPNGAPSPGTFEEHAQARLAATNEAVPDDLDLDAWRRQCQEPVATGALYDLLASHHVVLGHAFRWIDALWRGEQTVMCRFRVAGPNEEHERFGLHPGLIDSCFQLLGATVLGDDATTCIPVGVERLWLAATIPAGPLWGRAQFRLNADRRLFFATGDIEVIDEAGRVVVEFAGIRMKQVQDRSLRPAAASPAATYGLEWEHEAVETESAAQADTASNIVVSDDAVFAALITEAFFANSMVSAAEFDASRWIDGAVGQVKRIIFAPARDPAQTDLVKHCQASCLALTRILQAMTTGGTAGRTELLVVTRGGQGAGRAVSQPAQAAHWAIVRTAIEELPDLHLRCLDLPEAADLSDLRRAWAAVSARPHDHLVAVTAGSVYRPRLSRLRPSSNAALLRVSGDAAYVITGGTGALGLATATWLADRGAKHLLLISRHADAFAEDARVIQLRARGVEVVLNAVDAADRAALQLACGSAQRPIRGIVHAAGVLADATIANATVADWHAVMHPKVQALCNLHDISAGWDLNFFIAYSSAASLLGSPGQVNYVAANAVVDAFMAYRQGQGLPGLAINWGPWSGPGMTADQASGHEVRLAKQGVFLLQPTDALAQLDAAFGHGLAQVAVLSMDWARFVSAHPLYSRLSASKHAATVFVDELKSLPRGQREIRLGRHLADRVLSVLGKPTGTQVVRDLGFAVMGMDSLMSLELRNALQLDFRCRLPSTLIFKYPTLDELATFFAVEILGWRMQVAEPAAAPAASNDGLAELDEAELAALLENELGASGGDAR